MDLRLPKGPTTELTDPEFDTAATKRSRYSLMRQPSSARIWYLSHPKGNDNATGRNQAE